MLNSTRTKSQKKAQCQTLPTMRRTPTKSSKRKAATDLVTWQIGRNSCLHGYGAFHTSKTSPS